MLFQQLLLTAFSFVILCIIPGAVAENLPQVQKMDMGTTSEMIRSDIYYYLPAACTSVLILCPGQNGNGSFYFNSKEWTGFASKNNMGMIGLSFASRNEDIDARRSYFDARRESGGKVLKFLDEHKAGGKPLFLYGTSAGAHFTSSFVEMHPDRVASWCAYSAAWWMDPGLATSRRPPGIVACGELDGLRYGATFAYFAKGRKNKRNWTWVSLKNAGHGSTAPFESFVRDYFQAVLDRKENGLWVDIYKKEELVLKQSPESDQDYAWLPAHSLLPAWSTLHQP